MHTSDFACARKTLVARTLAKSSGLDYAIMSGGDVGPLGSDAVPQIHALFEWAKQSSRGLLLFIDEAETFLASRSGSGMSKEHHNALNALLYNTGTQSHNFVMVRYQYLILHPLREREREREREAERKRDASTHYDPHAKCKLHFFF